MSADAIVGDLSFGQGGPLRRLERISRVARESDREPWIRRSLVYVIVIYAPLVVVGIGYFVATGQWLAPLTRFHTHATALVSVPLLFFAETAADRRGRETIAYLVESGVVAERDMGALRNVIELHARARTSVAIELVLLGIAVASVAAGRPALAGPPFAGWWQAIVAAGVLRFLFLRWLWRWGLWALLLFKLSRLPLHLVATHADQFGGLAPVMALSQSPYAIFVAAVAAAAAGGWADRLHVDPSAFETLHLEVAAFSVVAVALSLAPMLSFAVVLHRVRKDGLRHYGALTLHHDRAFGARWRNRDGQDALGSPDMSSLADLGSSFARVDAMRSVMWSKRLLAKVLLGAWLPLVPILLAQVGFVNLLERVFAMVT